MQPAHSWTFICREMLAEGAWKRLNMSDYITCDDYDGKNAPKRTGLDLKSYFTKVIS